MGMSLDQITECLLDQFTGNVSWISPQGMSLGSVHRESLLDQSIGNVSWISPQGMSLGLVHKESILAPFTGNVSRSVQREYLWINLTVS
jgi:hypothetical protein